MPVPPVTTASIICVSSSAVCVVIARLYFRGFVRVTIAARGETIRSTTCGCMITPPFATVAATIAICSGVTSIRSWPKASRPGSTCVAGSLG